MPKPKIKNPHQAALYAAEKVLSHQARRFTDIRQVRTYVDGLVGSEWFYERWPELEVVTVHRRSSGATWSIAAEHGHECGEIFLTSLDIATILHELAHLCTPDDPGHGVSFAEAFLTLVRHEMGFFAWADLYQALRSTEPFQYVREGVKPKEVCYG